MFQTFVSGVGRSGLAAHVFEARLLKALDSIATLIVRRIAGERVSWIEADGMGDTALLDSADDAQTTVVRSVGATSWQQWAAVLGASKLGSLCRVRRSEKGWAREAYAPLAKQE
eukprot:9497166-Pyramimonas_sp.AAC.1